MEFFIAIGWDAPDSREKRPAIRPQLLAYWKEWEDQGRIQIAGPMTDFAGSLFIVQAPSRADVEAKIRNDPYVQAGIFVRTEVHPFKPSLPASVWQK